MQEFYLERSFHLISSYNSVFLLFRIFQIFWEHEPPICVYYASNARGNISKWIRIHQKVITYLRNDRIVRLNFASIDEELHNATIYVIGSQNEKSESNSTQISPQGQIWGFKTIAFADEEI